MVGVCNGGIILEPLMFRIAVIFLICIALEMTVVLPVLDPPCMSDAALR